VIRLGPRIIAAALALLWLATARQALIVNPDMALAFVALNAYLLCFVGVWEFRSRGHGDMPIYLLVLGPILLPYLVLAAVGGFVLGPPPQEP
jgi:hypothetical protein